MTGTVTDTAWYVFGVVPAGAGQPRGTSLVEHGDVAAVAAEVSLEEFGDDVIAERLNDREWLEEKVRTHENVLQWFVGVTAVVPLRFGAIYRETADIRALLAERTEFFETSLARLRDRVELGVKAWFDAARIERAPAAGGRAYLERRRGELTSARDAAAAAAAAHERLLALAVDGVVNRPQPRELTGRDEKMLLNAAYLVPAGRDSFADELARLGEEHAALGVAYELTGPWPPYNFAREDEPA